MSDGQRWPDFRRSGQNIVNRLNKLMTYMTTGWRRRLVMVLLVLLSAAIIAQILANNWQLILDYEWQFRPGWLVIALALFAVDLFIGLYVWHLIVSRLAHFSNLRLNIKFVLQANLARRLPGTIWYVANRALLYQEVGVPRKTISVLSALEMAMYIISGAVVTLVTLPLWLGNSGLDIEPQLIWILALIVPISLSLLHPRVIESIWSYLNRSKPIQTIRWYDSVLWLLLFIGTWVVGGGVLFSIINVFQPLPLTEYITITGMWAAAGTISLIGFVTLSFFSLREVTLVFLLSQLLPLPIALIIAVAVRVIWLAGELLASLLAMKL